MTLISLRIAVCNVIQSREVSQSPMHGVALDAEIYAALVLLVHWAM